MSIAKVKISGTASLLMNRMPQATAEKVVKKKTDVIDPKQDALKKAYHDEKLGFYLPSDTIEGCLREAGKNIKAGRGTLKKTVLASVFCKTDKVKLDYRNNEVDSRFSIHPSTGNGVMCNRMRFDGWKAEFELEFDADRVDVKTLEELIIEGGKVIGMGSYRPKFGRYKLDEFKVTK